MTPLCWVEVGDRSVLGPEIIQKTMKRIKEIHEKMKKAQDRWKSYVDQMRIPLEFGDKDHVLLKFTPRFRLKGHFMTKKLGLGYIGPYQIIRRVGGVEYQLALPPSLFRLHDVFHISQLRKFVPDPFQPILSEMIEVAVDLTFQPQPACIINDVVKALRNKEITLVKLLWEESTKMKLLRS